MGRRIGPYSSEPNDRRTQAQKDFDAQRQSRIDQARIDAGTTGRGTAGFGSRISSAINPTTVQSPRNAIQSAAEAASGAIKNPVNPVNPVGEVAGLAPKPYSDLQSMKAIEAYFPEFDSIRDAEGRLRNQYWINRPQDLEVQTMLNPREIDVNAFSADRRALNAMRDRALSEGNSPWANLQLQSQAIDEADARSRAGRAGAGALGTAQSSLAMRGGMASGARERMARAGAMDLAAQRQGIGQEAARRRLDIGIADDQQKMNLLSQIPGLDLGFANQRAGLEQYNIGNKFDADRMNVANVMQKDMFNRQMQFDVDRQNQAQQLADLANVNNMRLAKYNSQMGAIGGEEQARALAAGGGGGGSNVPYGRQVLQHWTTPSTYGLPNSLQDIKPWDALAPSWSAQGKLGGIV